MTDSPRPSGSELFIVDNSDNDWKVARYLHDWCELSESIDIATGYFEIGALLALDGAWQKIEKFRVLMGDEVSLRSKDTFAKAFARRQQRLDGSLESEKRDNVFLEGVPAIVEAISNQTIKCRVYRRDKFHAKAYITHARSAVVGSAALVGSSNFTKPGLGDNVELNVRLTGTEVPILQDWYDRHWDLAEDVTAEILMTIVRHTEHHSPFEVFAQSLHHLFRDAPTSASEWEKRPIEEGGSRVYKVLDTYQKDGYQNLIKIANQFDGAFLCDGVGLGKTFVGMMLLERFVKQERKNVVLIVPKAARKAVWEASLEQTCPELLGTAFGRLEIINHSDITRKASGDTDWPRKMADLREKAEVVIIDEAHHFRNPGVQVDVDSTNPNLLRAKNGKEPSRYRRLYHMLEQTPDGAKKVFLLTATPVNNHINDLRHMIELFSRKDQAHFETCGIQSLRSHFRALETELERQARGQADLFTDSDEAQAFLSKDPLFSSIVVQRSRSFVRESQEIESGSTAQFPTREPPRRAEYNVRATYGNLLDAVEKAFSKQTPLFRLAIYNSAAYAIEPDESKDAKIEENRQTQVIALVRTNFLKRFESSAKAFEASCERLLIKMLAWLSVNSETQHEKDRLAKWKHKYEKILGRVAEHQPLMDRHQSDLFAAEEEAEEDIVPEEMKLEIEPLDRRDYRVDEMIDDTIDDLSELIGFLAMLQKFTAKQDDKLKKLIVMLQSDKELKGRKVLIFSEFSDTAEYICEHLEAAGLDGLCVIDGTTSPDDRLDVIRRFSPYYNRSTSTELDRTGSGELRILVSTDVLSEGLNLQDATRLINYDLHWNPVRLMQRIGRVDRRLNPAVEEQLLADHPECVGERGRIVFWNFLPPNDLEGLLKLYERVSKKTLRISKVFGIEGKQLLTPEDDFDALKDLNAKYDGQRSRLEDLRLEYQRIIKGHDGISERLDSFPSQIHSGRTYPDGKRLEGRGVFFCYALPALDTSIPVQTHLYEQWTEDAGETLWYLLDTETGKILTDPPDIADFIRSTPETARAVEIPKAAFLKARKTVEQHILKTYLMPRDAAAGVNGRLVAWMELH